MYAVIKTGGKQYRVAPEDVITVERLDGAEGALVTFGEVLMLGGEAPQIGAPTVAGASVAGEIVGQGRGDKIIVFKKKRRQNYRRKKGHRQLLTTVRVTEILTGGAKPAKKAAKPAAKPAQGKAAKTAAPAAATDSPAAKSAAKPAAKSAKSAAKTESGAPMLYEKAPEKVDDLTRLDGVGPKSAEALNALGVYTFAQIASWSPAEIDWIDERVKVKKLFEREGWPKAVKALAKGGD